MPVLPGSQDTGGKGHRRHDHRPDLANTQAIEAGNFDDYNLLPSPKAMIVAPPESVPHIQTCLADYLKDSVYLAQSQPYLIEIMPAGINKANSLKLLCNRLSIDSSEVMACGDNTNDAEMIRWAGVGVGGLKFCQLPQVRCLLCVFSGKIPGCGRSHRKIHPLIM